jgi:TetR/AcrR family transcriptional repressor of nem operon
VIGFFDDNEAWLTRVLEQGQANGTLSLCESASHAAKMIVSGLEGAMLVARPYSDLDRFKSAADCLLASLTT